MDYVDRALDIVRRHINGPLFSYDAALVADPLYFICSTIAESESPMAREEDFNLCLHAMRRSGWAFTRSEDRERSLQVLWDITDHERHISLAEFNSNSPSITSNSGGSGSSSDEVSSCITIGARQDAAAFPSTSDSPAFTNTSSDSAFTPPALSLQDLGIPPIPVSMAEADEIAARTADQLLQEPIPSHCVQNQLLSTKPKFEPILHPSRAAFALRPVTEFLPQECGDEFVAPPNAMDDIAMSEISRESLTPMSYQLYETYTNGDDFLH